MKPKINSIRFVALFLLMGLFAFGCQSQNKEQNSSSSPTETAPLVEAKITDVPLSGFQDLIARDGMQILDVRTDPEVAEGIVASARHLNIHGPDFREKAAKMLDKTSPVVVYCRSGGRSAKASAVLQELGFKEIYNYTGGMSEWKAKGLPTTTN